MKKLNLYKNHYIIAFLSTLVISIGLLIGSFFMPPKGVIDPSVMKATAEMFMWPALAFGVKAISVNKELKKRDEDEE